MFRPRPLHAFLTLTLALVGGSAFGQVNVFSDGSDGAFRPTQSVVIDLGLARTGRWNQPGDGNGVYDPVQWAVVFKFTEVNIPAGVTVRFKNHPSKAPVVFLVSGDAVIAGSLNVDGGDYNPAVLAEGGPGGFFGGRTPTGIPITPGGGHFGADRGGQGGGYSSANTRILPLIGGGGSTSSEAGGGGAVLIAVARQLSVTGSVRARSGVRQSGGYVAGGGGIRIVCDRLVGTGAIDTSGSGGRVRIEANSSSFTGSAVGSVTSGLPGADAVLWPDQTAPRVTVVSVDGVAVPADPNNTMAAGATDLRIDKQVPLKIVIEGRNLPADWKVEVRIAGERAGDATRIQATKTGEQGGVSTWEATVTMPPTFSSVTVRAYKP